LFIRLTNGFLANTNGPSTTVIAALEPSPLTSI